MMPYDGPFISKLLRAMPDGAVAAAHPYDFQRQPVVVVTRAATIRELIANERARRSQ
jgi:hypothetical protein